MHTIVNDDFFIEKGFFISTDKDLIDAEAVFKYLSKDSYWAKSLPKDRFMRSLENSVCFGVYQDNAQAAFARVITDKATFAYICDVFVMPEFRRLGLSKWLIQSIVTYPDFEGLRRWSLATSDAHGLYGQFGFTPIARPDTWMEIFRPYQSLKKEEEQ